MSDTVTHRGRRYRLAHLAHYMEHDQREAVHFSDAAEGTAQEWWDEFARRYPAEESRP